MPDVLSEDFFEQPADKIIRIQAMIAKYTIWYFIFFTFVDFFE